MLVMMEWFVTVRINDVDERGERKRTVKTWEGKEPRCSVFFGCWSATVEEEEGRRERKKGRGLRHVPST